MRSFARLLLAPLAAACGSDAPVRDREPVVAFDTVEIGVATARDTLTLTVELAENRSQWAHGLMERDALAPDAGMLFAFPGTRAAEDGFWMFRTRIPLDIAYLDAEGRILRILSMAPCESPDPQWCPRYPPGTPYRSALEVGRGWFERHGVREGDRVLLPPR